LAVAPNGRPAGCSPCSTTKRPHPWLYKWNLKNADEGRKKGEKRIEGTEEKEKKKQRRERGRTERREKPREEKKEDQNIGRGRKS